MTKADHSGVDSRTEIVHSPDDGGYYLEQSEATPTRVRFRVSKTIWPTAADARRALMYGDVTWRKWA